MFAKLERLGAQGTHFDTLKHMYTNTQATVNVDGCYSHLFLVDAGVQQECPLSPFLFILYIGDLNLEDPNDPEYVDGCTLSFLLLADDLTFSSTTREGLQQKLNKLAEACQRWKIRVSESKTQVMCISRNKEWNKREVLEDSCISPSPFQMCGAVNSADVLNPFSQPEADIVVDNILEARANEDDGPENWVGARAREPQGRERDILTGTQTMGPRTGDGIEVDVTINGRMLQQVDEYKFNGYMISDKFD